MTVVLDEPSRGLHPSEVSALTRTLSELRDAAVRKAFAASEGAVEQGITIKDLTYRCDACRGKGVWQENMSFLPSVTQTYDACRGSGYRRESATLV